MCEAQPQVTLLSGPQSVDVLNQPHQLTITVLLLEYLCRL